MSIILCSVFFYAIRIISTISKYCPLGKERRKKKEEKRREKEEGRRKKGEGRRVKGEKKKRVRGKNSVIYLDISSALDI